MYGNYNTKHLKTVFYGLFTIAADIAMTAMPTAHVIHNAGKPYYILQSKCHYN